MTDLVPTSFTCNETLYPSINAIPAYATELIFENNSYPNVQTLDLSRFPQLHTLIVKNGAFPDCYYVYINNPELRVINIGEGCFTGVPPTQPSTELPTTPLPTSFTCNENIYPTIESIPAYATELIFENNSYPNIQTLDLSRFTQLRNLIVKNGAFANC